jgi:RNA polymerase sigma factor (sigma-70 family)
LPQQSLLRENGAPLQRSAQLAQKSRNLREIAAILSEPGRLLAVRARAPPPPGGNLASPKPSPVSLATMFSSRTHWSYSRSTSPSMDDDDLHLSRIQTAWSMVRRAHFDHTALPLAQQALLERYGGAVRRYALAALRDDDAADEVFQEFALRFVRGDFKTADPERGRFRAFVKTAVYRLIVDYQRRQKKRHREGPMHSNMAEEQPIDSDAVSVGGSEDDALFRASWRDELLARCWKKLEEVERDTRKPYYTALRYRVDHPELRSPELAAGLTELLGKPINAGAARVLLHRAREEFADLLLAEVADSLADSSLDAAEEELIELNLLEYCRPALERRRGKTE